MAAPDRRTDRASLEWSGRQSVECRPSGEELVSIVKRRNQEWLAELQAVLARGLGFAPTHRPKVDETLIENFVQEARQRLKKQTPVGPFSLPFPHPWGIIARDGRERSPDR